MTRVCALFLVLCVLAALMIPAQAATSRMPYGSFLTKPISSAQEFAQLIRTDKVVAKRFAAHFGMDSKALADYIQKYGEVKTISKSGVYVEYFLDKRGQIHKHNKRLPAKHRVLFIKGTPILDVDCGNPMTKALPKIAEKPKPPPTVAVKPTPAPPPVVTPPPVEQPAPVAPPPVEVVEQPPVVPAPEQPPVVAVKPQVEVFPQPGEVPPSGGRRGGFLLPILAGIGALFNGGGGGGDNPPPVIPPEEPVIPESSTLMLGIGGMGFILARYRRHRGRQ